MTIPLDLSLQALEELEWKEAGVGIEDLLMHCFMESMVH